ncbi:MAG: hypothetical protein LUH51_08590 [Firmicutes bacterium]|nr:hypothetical protein [Bacillota bacterium]
MKKILTIFLAVVLAFGCFGCSAEEPEQSNNSLFTDSFCEDVVLIAFWPGGEVSGEQVGPVLEYLKSLTLTETDEHISYSWDEIGGCSISLRKSNGYEATFIIGDQEFTSWSSMVHAETVSYVADEDFLPGLQEAFEQGLALSEAEGDT